MPLLAGFWGPFLAILGAFARDRLLGVLAILAALVLVSVHLFALGHILFGEPREVAKREWPELRRLDLAACVPLALLIVALGVSPRPLLAVLDRSVIELHRRADQPWPLQIAGTFHERPCSLLESCDGRPISRLDRAASS
jgi:NADH-quinone oxidoreductase subunit M